MGQYHHVFCIEAEEGLTPSSFGVALKEGEQGYSYPSTPQAMVALVCARGGNMPADCSQSPIIGKWAGNRVLVVGDYAEDGDIPNWKGPPLSRLYHALAPEEGRQPQQDWTGVPLFRDISIAARGFLEAACNVRYFGQEQTCRDMVPGSKTYGQIIDRWTNTEWVRVRPVAREFGGSGIAEYVIDPSYSAKDLERLKRCGMDPIDVQRPPRTGDWHGLLPAEIAEGHRRLIVNLDTLEYIDPVKFGQVPTLAGIVADVPERRCIPAKETIGGRKRTCNLLKKAAAGNEHLVSVATGLFVMLCHSKRRGGGDIPASAAEMGSTGADRQKFAKLFAGAEDVKGRWRGSRILGTGEIRYEDWPTSEEVIERGTDISDAVIRYLVAISHY